MADAKPAQGFGNIIICRADQVVKKTRELKPAAVLSIEHPDVRPGEHGYVPRLDDATPQKILSFWDSEHGAQKGPDLEQVEAGMLYVFEHLKKGDVIVHCHAGVSRSTGLALGVLSMIHPNIDENKLVDMLLEIRPQSGPNIIVVDHADRLTGRGGKLLQAVKDNETITIKREKAELGRKGWLQRNPDTYRKMHPEKFPPK
jgi:predicted protein tyrosine phosphatase